MNQYWIPIAISWLALACGRAAAPAQHLRFAEVGKSGAGVDWTRPVVLEFQPGDRLPVRVAFSDQVFELSPAASAIELVAKRRGFLRIEQGRITGSLTGDDFDATPLAPGQFRFGIAVTKNGSWVDLAVTTPRHAEPMEQKP
ncbi:MAG TPA: hypothetical protein VJN18_33970 [Polyangiaceae bacterium]|nr:hypothetical protein [Polyangiaceae bacterium]